MPIRQQVTAPLWQASKLRLRGGRLRKRIVGHLKAQDEARHIMVEEPMCR